jgi:hypothetical protein
MHFSNVILSIVNEQCKIATLGVRASLIFVAGMKQDGLSLHH